MEDTIDSITNNSEDMSQFMEITPAIEDLLVPVVSDNMENPFYDEMIKDELVPADIDYFCKTFTDLAKVKFERIHCTCCNKHLGTAIDCTPERFKHPLLKVVQCEDCYLFYCSGDFEKDKDGSELYCRWCGEGGQVFCCSKCPYVFCKKCISRNLGRGTASIIENSDDWLCFNCNPCQISKQRATCWAIMKYVENIKELAESDPDLKTEFKIDYSGCCQSKSKRTRSILSANKESQSKKIKVDVNYKLLKDAILGYQNENNSKSFDWTVPTGPEDEVICTPDILPFEESPPNSPQPPDITEKPPSLKVASPRQSPINSGPPKLTPIILARKSTTPHKTLNQVAQTTLKSQRASPRPIAPKITLPIPLPNKIKVVTPSQINNVKITPIVLNTNSSSACTNKQVSSESGSKTISGTQKIMHPISIQLEDQWFNTAVVKSADVTEYISSNVTKLASQINKNLSDQEKAELYKTFEMYIDIAISKLKSIRQNMQFSFNNLRKQKTAQTSVQLNTPKAVQSIVQPTETVESTEYASSKPKRAAARKKRISYVESSSSDEWVANDDDDEDFSIGKKKKKTSPVKPQTASEIQTVQHIIPVQKILQHNQVTIVKTNSSSKKTKDQVILDVIDLVDDNSSDPLDNPDTENKTIKSFLPITTNIIVGDDNSVSGNEKEDEPVSDIDSDISEILPDHLVDSPSIKPHEIENEEHITNGDNEINENEDHNIKKNELEDGKDRENNDEKSESESKVQKSEDSSINSRKLKEDEILKDDTNENEDKIITYDKCDDEEVVVKDDENKNKVIKDDVDETSKKSEALSNNQLIMFENSNDSKDANGTENKGDEVDQNNEINSNKNYKNDVTSEKFSAENVASNNSNDSSNNDDKTEENSKEVINNGAKTNELSIKLESENCNEDNMSVNSNQNHSPDINDNSNLSENKSEKSYPDKSRDSYETNTFNDIEHDSISNEKYIEAPTKLSGVDTLEDFEDILTINTIPIVKEKRNPKANFGDEFSKFVNTNISPNPEDDRQDEDNEIENEYNDDEDMLDKELDMVSKMYEETEDDDALSLPPQNIVDFDISFKDKQTISDLDKNLEIIKNRAEANSSECGSSKISLESELNVLRKLAENCVPLNSEGLASDSKY